MIEVSCYSAKNVSIIQITKFGDSWRSYFSIIKKLKDKLRPPLDTPYRRDFRKNAKSKFHGLAELSASNKYEKQMTSTKQAHSVSHWNFILKFHLWVPTFGVQKQILISLCVDNFFAMFAFEEKSMHVYTFWWSHPKWNFHQFWSPTITTRTDIVLWRALSVDACTMGCLMSESRARN